MKVHKFACAIEFRALAFFARETRHQFPCMVLPVSRVTENALPWAD